MVEALKEIMAWLVPTFSINPFASTTSELFLIDTSSVCIIWNFKDDDPQFKTKIFIIIEKFVKINVTKYNLFFNYIIFKKLFLKK